MAAENVYSFWHLHSSWKCCLACQHKWSCRELLKWHPNRKQIFAVSTGCSIVIRDASERLSLPDNKAIHKLKVDWQYWCSRVGIRLRWFDLFYLLHVRYRFIYLEGLGPQMPLSNHFFRCFFDAWYLMRNVTRPWKRCRNIFSRSVQQLPWPNCLSFIASILTSYKCKVQCWDKFLKMTVSSLTASFSRSVERRMFVKGCRKFGQGFCGFGSLEKWHARFHTWGVLWQIHGYCLIFSFFSRRRSVESVPHCPSARATTLEQNFGRSKSAPA